MPPVTKYVEFAAKMIPTGEPIRETGEISGGKGSSRGDLPVGSPSKHTQIHRLAIKIVVI